jgi:hypothetical protein
VLYSKIYPAMRYLTFTHSVIGDNIGFTAPKLTLRRSANLRRNKYSALFGAPKGAATQDGLSTGAKVGIGLGAPAALLAIGFIFWLCRR